MAVEERESHFSLEMRPLISCHCSEAWPHPHVHRGNTNSTRGWGVGGEVPEKERSLNWEGTFGGPKGSWWGEGEVGGYG